MRSGLGLALLLVGVWLQRAAAWLVRALPAIAAGLAAAVPVLVSTVHAANAGWEPAGDDGIILTRAWDVLTSHSPLVGQYSEAGNVTGQIVHSPGPLLYWLLALPVRYGNTIDVAIWMGAVNTLAIIACVALARRRGGLVLMFATAIGIALMCQSLASESFHDVWNPAAALFPFLLLVFLCWSLACGEHRLLPWVVLVASFVTQTHLTYVAPTAGLLLIGVGGLVVRRVVARRRGGASKEPQPSGPRARGGEHVSVLWRWVLAAVLVGAVCWAPPLLDELEHSPGNLTLVVRTTSDRGTTLGSSIGANAVVDAIGWKPWWLYVPASEWSRKHDVRVTPSSSASDSTLAILAALVLIAAVGLWRRRGDLAAAALIGLAMCAALDANIANTPVVPLLAATIGYTAWWGSILGLWVWLVLAWALWLSLRWLALRSGPLVRRASASFAEVPAGARKGACVLASLGCLAGVAATGNAVAATEKPDSHVNQYHPIATLVAALDRIVPPGQSVRFELGANDVSTQPIEPGVRFGLVRHGDLVLSNGAHQRLGYYYELENKPYSWFVYIANGKRHRKHMLLAVTVHFHDAWGRNTFSAWVAKVGPGKRLSVPSAVPAA
ncbi:MAG: hypothetical protein ABR947_09315 [Solirubrobacteraceae bacterium]